MSGCGEQVFWLNADGLSLAGVYHPAFPDAGTLAAMVFVHPLFDEKKSAHRILVETARNLAGAGVAVLRFDLAGCGDSQGDLATQSPEVWKRNIAIAAAWLAERTPGTPLGLLGVRMGATLGLAAVDSIPDARFLALWEPVADGSAWLRERLRQRLAREMLAGGHAAGGGTVSPEKAAMDVDGFNVPAPLSSAIETIGNGMAQGLRFDGSALILGIGGASRSKASLEALRTRLAGRGANAEIKHLRAPPFWNRLEPHPCPEAGALTLEWLRAAGLPAARPASRTVDARQIAGEPAGAAGERFLDFRAPEGLLRGILHPATATDNGLQPGPAILFLHGWGAYRIGPHRMFVNAARVFAARGMPVFRFDFGGRGESEGVTRETTIEVMTEDACLALHKLREAMPGRRLVVLGMCSGAKVACALAAARGAEIAGLVFWSPEPPDEAEHAAGGVRAVRRRGDVARAYAQKLLNPSVWRKAVAGAVNWRLVYKALLGRRGPDAGERDRDQAVYRAFEEYGGRRLLVYGAADPAAAAACRHHRRLAQSAGADYQEHGIDHADHNFYHADWERQVIKVTAGWLN